MSWVVVDLFPIILVMTHVDVGGLMRCSNMVFVEAHLL